MTTIIKIHKTGLIKYACLILCSVLIASCTAPADKEKDDDAAKATITPVTYTTISTEPITDYVELNATSAFLQKSYVKANANGYIQTVNTQLGKDVHNGQALFTLKTKESQNIGSALSKLDSSLKFSGLIHISANADGFITQLNHQAGDYVQDGEQLAVISNHNSFVFLLDLPYELRSLIANDKNIELLLPDGQKLNGTITSEMPSVDAVSQTQSIVIKVNTDEQIPENLVAKVRLVKNSKSHAISVPKSAVLTDETQQQFWVMKMTDDKTAVKVPITKGIEADGRIEIVSPAFAHGDKILITGNYGLPDTAQVKASAQ